MGPFGKLLLLTFAGRRTLRSGTAGTTRTARRTAGAARATGTTRTAAVRRRRLEFIHRQIAIAVLIEFAQGNGRIVDFLRVKCAVSIRIERGYDRRHGTTSARTARTAGTRRTALRWFAILSDEVSRGASQGQRSGCPANRGRK